MPTLAEKVADRLAQDDVAHSRCRRDMLDYLCAGQLFLRRHPEDVEALTCHDVKARPAGHWGVCPNLNAVVSVLAPTLAGAFRSAASVRPVTLVTGAGHAGAAALARAWLDGALGAADARFGQTPDGLNTFFDSFPKGGPWGGEVTPLIPGVTYMGGQLGPALAFAVGTVLDRPERLVFPVLGDGECETGETAAAWLSVRAFDACTGRHGYVVPVVLLNGLRMGGASLLAGLTHTELTSYFAGLGWEPHIADGSQPEQLSAALEAACRHTGPVGSRSRHLVVCAMPKGFGAPMRDARGRALAGTIRVHKTPLTAPSSDPGELELLRSWLASYKPHRLLSGGRPTAQARWPSPRDDVARGDNSPRSRSPERLAAETGWDGSDGDAVGAEFDFPSAVASVLRRNAGPDFRVFSPDELSSNHIDADAAGAVHPCVEVLNEPMCHMWLQGYLESGRRGLFITYEAFATMTLSLLRQYAKTRALADRAGNHPPFSLVYLVTSLGWTNNYSHQDPAVYGGLLDTALPATHLVLPADPPRLAAALDRSLRSRGAIHLIAAAKTTDVCYPVEPMADELADGIAPWPAFSDDGDPDLVLCGAGDIATAALLGALQVFRSRRSGVRVRYVCLQDLTVLDPASSAGGRLSTERLAQLFPTDCPVVFAVPCHASTVKAMLFDRPDLARRSSVIGFVDPADVVTEQQLRHRSGMSEDRILDHLAHRLAS